MITYGLFSGQCKQGMKDKRLVIIFFTVFVDLVGFGMIIPLNPYLARAFGASAYEVGLLMSVYSLMQFVAAPVWGALSDRHGRRPVILLSLFGACVAHFGFACSSALWGLFLFRIFAGVFGGNLPAAMAYIADITPPEDRSKGMGLIGAAFGLGFILGPAIGGVMAQVGQHLGHTPPLGESFPAVVASLICLANAVTAYFYLPESLKEKRDVSANPASLVGKRFSYLLTSLKNPNIGGVLFLFFLSSFALAQVEVPLFLFVQGKYGWTMSQASYGFAYIGIIMVITQGYLIRKLLPKLKEYNLAPIGFVSMAIGLALISLTPHLAGLGLGVTLLAVGNGLANPSLTGTISLASSETEQGSNLGVSQSMSALARILGPALGGWIFGNIAMNIPFALSSAIAAVGLFMALVLRGQMRRVRA